ncbi:unnamed protein product [Paramecium sonneborni]|uniref:Uncharacterized protein n=1 Tax=Paramecium sonneborni TaxID=65129 RepID=A0A8S1R975_9CILI|nr:unnamed protein product [Paramecium sonneborni]
MGYLVLKESWKQSKEVDEANMMKNNQVINLQTQSKQENGLNYLKGFVGMLELNIQIIRKSQITYIGEYQNGKKVGRWDIFYKDLWTKKNYLIGGGQYNIKQDGGLIVNSNKNGKWIELNDGFWSYGQVFYSGDYINGNKQGRWDIYFKDEWKYENELIGGGTYIIEQDENNIVNSHKIGNWIELSDNFGNGFGQQQILYSGQYKNCQKIGIWYIMKRDKYKMEEGFKRSKKIFSYPNFIL